ncbi:flagellar basal body P-ring formation chaperone FlgA [Endozoicomonas ascidiicola]|uniref:flagellar basal body P-ring formation chaperone FlgA n=1 Tax=Endozoicomonas ascidiicola TaxID=1698521 RepID=UPI00082E7E7F|nr:flagellar basal body P-ring formation chaperone FlgA [Endozoicomonas ascidiicola]
MKAEILFRMEAVTSAISSAIRQLIQACTSRKAFSAFLIIAVSGALQAETFEHQVISAGEQFLHAKAARIKKTLAATGYETSVIPPSTRLSMPACSSTPVIEDFSRSDIGDQRLKVKCLSGKHWSVFLRGNIAMYKPVLTANRLLERGEAIPSSAVSLKRQNLAELRKGYLSSKQALAYRVTRVRIKTGTPIAPDMLTSEQLISRGDRVVIKTGDGTVNISVAGEAMEGGGINDQIRVRNLNSQKMVYGIVTGRGEITIK